MILVTMEIIFIPLGLLVGFIGYIVLGKPIKMFNNRLYDKEIKKLELKMLEEE
jgi:hypothetical protein